MIERNISSQIYIIIISKLVALWTKYILKSHDVVNAYLVDNNIQMWYCYYVPFELYSIGRGNYHHQYLLQTVKVKS